jgi:hypothetical protein
MKMRSPETSCNLKFYDPLRLKASIFHPEVKKVSMKFMSRYSEAD